MNFSYSLSLVALLITIPVYTKGQINDALIEPMPERWSYTTSFEQTLPCDDDWWKGFEDPVLDSLISMGIDNNFNLAIAAKRIGIAKSTLNSAKAAYYPTIGIEGGWTRERMSGMTATHVGNAMTEDYFSLGVNMSWEIDIFGKIRSSVKANDAQYKASKAEYAATMVSLAAQIAVSYIDLRVSQAQLDVALRHSAAQDTIVNMAQTRMDVGLGNALEVAQAKVVLYSTKASVPQLQNSVNQSINAIAILLGVYPEAITPLLEANTGLPSYNHLVRTGVPMELLRRRPDIVQAEMQLAAYAAQLGVAKKDFLPNLSLHGTIGTSAHKAGDLFKHQSYTYTIAPTLSWTVFDGFSRKNNVASARYQMEIGVDSYNQTVMTAIQETDNAMSAYLYTINQMDILTDVVEQSGKALKLSVGLWKQGLSEFTNVVNAQVNLLEYQNSLISAKGNALIALVNLYKAIGGGWDAKQL